MSEAERELHLRAKLLECEIEQDEHEIIVPTISVAEYLTGCDPSSWAAVVGQFSEHFHCPNFDLAAAQHAARIKQKWAAELKGKIYEDRRNVLSADMKILATGLANRAQSLYSNDADFRKLAAHFLEALELPIN